MNDILKKKASIWCDRLSKLMKDKGYTQQTFLKEEHKRMLVVGYV